MKYAIISILLSTIFTLSCPASNLPHPNEFTSVVEHLIASWDLRDEEATKVLKEELTKKKPEESIDIITKTCTLCKPQDANQTKATVAYTLSSLDPKGREEVTHFGKALKNLYRDVAIVEIVEAMATAPNYQRQFIYGMLASKNGPLEKSLHQIIKELSQSFSCLERGVMYFHYNTGGIFSQYTGPIVK